MDVQRFVVVLRHRPGVSVRIVNTVVSRGLDIRGIVYDADATDGLAVCVLHVAGETQRLDRLEVQLDRIVEVLSVRSTGAREGRLAS